MKIDFNVALMADRFLLLFLILCSLGVFLFSFFPYDIDHSANLVCVCVSMCLCVVCAYVCVHACVCLFVCSMCSFYMSDTMQGPDDRDKTSAPLLRSTQSSR